MGKGSAHIVIFAAARLDEFLKLRNDFFPASVSCIINAVAVVNLLAAVKAQNNVAHLTVCKVYHIIVNKHSVGGEGKAEIFALFLFNASCVLHKLFHNVKVHQRFAAEKVHLKIAPCSGVFNEEIERPLSDIKAHEGSFSVILSLRGKAIGAVEVAGVGNVQAKRLDNARGTRLKLACHRLKLVL